MAKTRLPGELAERNQSVEKLTKLRRSSLKEDLEQLLDFDDDGKWGYRHQELLAIVVSTESRTCSNQ